MNIFIEDISPRLPVIWNSLYSRKLIRFDCFKMSISYDVEIKMQFFFVEFIICTKMNSEEDFLLAKLTYKTPLSVSQSVRQSPFLKNLVRTTPPKRLDGLSWNLQGIFLKVSSCAPDKNFYRQSVSKSVSHQNQKILSGQLLLNGWME